MPKQLPKSFPAKEFKKKSDRPVYKILWSVESLFGKKNDKRILQFKSPNKLQKLTHVRG